MELSDKIKKFEHAHLKFDGKNYIIPNDTPMIARIDGHNFSTWTRPFIKPFDPRIAEAMKNTATDLLLKFHAHTAYTQSDEISLVFMPEMQRNGKGLREYPFGGRVMKITSLLSSYASARFNYHLTNQFLFMDSSPAKKNALDGTAHFDARLFSLPEYDVLSYFQWRLGKDCHRNAVHGLARQHFSSKELLNKSSTEQIKMLQTKGIQYDHMPSEYRCGIFIKKCKVQSEAVNKKSGREVTVDRTITSHFCLGPEQLPANETVLTSKYR